MQILHALLWFAFQNQCSNLVAVVSYTWRAALHVSTPTHVGVSTSNFYGISPNLKAGESGSDEAKARVQNNLRDVRLIFHDEYSFIDQAREGGGERKKRARKTLLISRAVPRTKQRYPIALYISLYISLYSPISLYISLYSPIYI